VDGWIQSCTACGIEASSPCGFVVFCSVVVQTQVLVVGIPFPSFKDLKVELKRKYQAAKYQKDKHLPLARRPINGREW